MSEPAAPQPNPAPTSLRVIHLEAENYLGLRAVAFDPDANCVVLSGENGSGKSSVLSAIEFALRGRAAEPEMPVRVPHAEGHVFVVLGDDGKPAFKVRREVRRGKESRLVLENADGNRPLKPQELLDAMVGALAFDPLEFARPRGAKTPEARRKAQVEMLLRVCPLDVDLDKLAAARAEKYETRRFENAALKDHEARLSLLPLPPSEIPAEVDFAGLEKRLTEALNHNTGVDRVRGSLAAERRLVDAAQAEVERATRTLEDAKVRLAQAEEAVAHVGEPVDIEALRADVHAAREKDLERLRALEAKRRREAAREARDASRKRSEELTAAIAWCDKTREDAIAKAKFPVPGLGLDEAGVTVAGPDGARIPFEQASTGQQVEVSFAIAAAAAPACKVVFVPDGNDLDEKTMARVRELAAAKGLQLWIERVVPGPGSVVIRDGAIERVEPAGGAA